MKAHKGNILEYKTYDYLKVNETDVAARESAGAKKAEGQSVFDSYNYGISPEMIQLHDNHATVYRRITAEDTVDLGIESIEGIEDEVITMDFIVEEGAHMTGCFRSKKTGGYRSFLSRIHVKKNGVARLYFVNIDQAEVDNYLSMAAILEEGARLDAYVFHLGDGNETSNVKCFLKGEGSLGNIQSIYLGKKGQAYDFIYDMVHEGRDTTSNLIVDGALMEDSYKVFKSRIDFLEGYALLLPHPRLRYGDGGAHDYRREIRTGHRRGDLRRRTQGHLRGIGTDYGEAPSCCKVVKSEKSAKTFPSWNCLRKKNRWSI